MPHLKRRALHDLSCCPKVEAHVHTLLAGLLVGAVGFGNVRAPSIAVYFLVKAVECVVAELNQNGVLAPVPYVDTSRGVKSQPGVGGSWCT